MVSVDSPERNQEFADSVGAGFPVISDPDKSVAASYGVMGVGGLYTKRWTFYIDPDGVIRKIDKDVNPSTAGGRGFAHTLGRDPFPLVEEHRPFSS